MPSQSATDQLTKIIHCAFAQSDDEYRREVATASERAQVHFAPIRPVFVTGNPDDVARGRYLLFVGLNPKLDVKDPSNTAHYADLDRGAPSNAAITLGYFRNIRALHGYYKRRAVLVRAFLEALGREVASDDRELLKRAAVFAERIPYHSEAARGDLTGLDDLPNVARARQAIRLLLDEHRPEAIVLDGTATHTCLPDDGPFKQIELEQRTGKANRACRVAIGTHRKIPVLKCGFIGSIGGVNSRAQRREAGRLLAAEVLSRHCGECAAEQGPAAGRARSLAPLGTAPGG
ncbi:hypothetical protein WMF38_52000 [Sorangium sp. So ce118]